jgi:arylsulfatase A-like enzyme
MMGYKTPNIDRIANEGALFTDWYGQQSCTAGRAAFIIYADGMVEHDRQVGQMLEELKKLGLEENTIVMYSPDNGAEAFAWPDGGMCATLLAAAGEPDVSDKLRTGHKAIGRK